MKRILVIEDEPQLAEVLGENLREDGYEVVLAGNGQEGLRKVQLTKPDLIILDVVMPKMDGAETYAHLQDSEKTKHIPVIFLTGLKTKSMTSCWAKRSAPTPSFQSLLTTKSFWAPFVR